ncbi:hypothetical protein Tco_1404474 [Tanacetum coccineum]
MADQNLAAYDRSFDINTSFPNLCDLVSNDTTHDVVMARTNVASPVVVSSVSTSITKEGCGKAHIGEGVNKLKDMVASSNASTDSMGHVNVEQTCTASGLNGSAIKNGSEKVGNTPLNVVPPSYATKLRPTSSIMAYLRKLEANVPNDADYDVWLPLDTVHEVNDRMKSSLYMHFVGKKACFSCREMVLLRDGPWLIRNGYTKETIHVEYEWKPPRFSTCLIFGHSFDDCPKSPKRVVNKMDKGKGGSSGADDEGFVKVKMKKSGGNNRGNKNFKLVSLKPKPQYRPKAKQSTKGANQKTTPSISKKKVSISGNGTFSHSNSFEALNDSEDEIESVDNEMASYLTSKPSRVGYGTNVTPPNQVAAEYGSWGRYFIDQ